MPDKLLIALDFHGLIVDHDKAKHTFFCEIEEEPYEHANMDREEIQAVFSDRGLPKSFYYAAIKRFLESGYAKNCPIVPGVRNFMDATPDTWDFLIVTGPHSDLAGIKETVGQNGLPRVRLIRKIADNERRSFLASHGVRIYFDDKRSFLDEMAELNIGLIHIRKRGRGRASQKADRVYQTWEDALVDIEWLISLAKGIRPV